MRVDVQGAEGLRRIRSEFQSRGFQIPSIVSQHASELCHAAFSPEEYLAERDALASAYLENMERKETLGLRGACEMKFDLAVERAYETGRQWEFHREVERRKADEAALFPEIMATPVRTGRDLSRYVLYVGERLGFSFSEADKQMAVALPSAGWEGRAYVETADFRRGRFDHTGLNFVLRRSGGDRRWVFLHQPVILRPLVYYNAALSFGGVADHLVKPDSELSFKLGIYAQMTYFKILFDGVQSVQEGLND